MHAVEREGISFGLMGLYQCKASYMDHFSWDRLEGFVPGRVIFAWAVARWTENVIRVSGGATSGKSMPCSAACVVRQEAVERDVLFVR